MTTMPAFPAATLAQAEAEFRARGVAVLGPPALPPALHAALVAEAWTQEASQGWTLTGSRARGEIAQDSRRAHLGPVARGLLDSAEIAALLRHATGRALAPAWSATCYTLYRGPGQHMGEHCDKADACAVALLIYLAAQWPGQAPGPGLQLQVFQGDNSATALAAVVTTHPNRCVILNGARQAHQRPPLAAGEHLLMLAGCFHVA